MSGLNRGDGKSSETIGSAVTKEGQAVYKGHTDVGHFNAPGMGVE